MRNPLEIPVPTAEELEALETLYRTTRDVRLRTRAQMMLLAAEQRLTAPAIAKIVREDDQTVRNWLKRYLAEGIEGLKDRPMPGAPPKVTKAYAEQLLSGVRRQPRSLHARRQQQSHRIGCSWCTLCHRSPRSRHGHTASFFRQRVSPCWRAAVLLMGLTN